MNKKVFKILIGIFIAAIFSSCLKIGNEPEIPTQQEETAELQAYLSNLIDAGHDIDTTELGVYYIVLEEGEGNYSQVGDSLEVGYAAFFTDGTMFDASDKYVENGTYSFVLGNPDLIAGWNDGMKVINKDAKVQLIIPSQLAYGNTGQGNIPPYKTLVFVIKMLEIIPST